jgi:SNF2 family DNA or RNA helicase
VLVVHGAWVGGRLALWAEDARTATSTPAGTSTAASAAEGGRPHPFAAAAADLATALGEIATKADEVELAVQLPGSAKAPLPSPDSGLASGIRKPAIHGWTVPALLLRPADADGVLDAADDVPADADWLPAGSLRYLAVVAGHARDLVRRGRLLPQLVTEDGEPAARWVPVLTGPDAAAFRDLAAAMPPVCRAARPPAGTDRPAATAAHAPGRSTPGTSTPGRSTPGTSTPGRSTPGRSTPGRRAYPAAAARPAGTVLREALAGLVDAEVRRALPDRLLGGHRPSGRSPLADRWVVALTAEDPVLRGADPTAAAALRQALSRWLAAAYEANLPIRVCFRLTEPGAQIVHGVGPDEWALEFALQSTEDPSLYVPAEQIWTGARIGGLPSRPDETLLTGLGRAVRLYPGLHDALRTARPSRLPLTTAEAFEFLRQAAPLLQAAGFAVQLPSWAGRKALSLKLTTRAKSRTGPGAAAAQGFGLDQLVDFRLELALGEDAISEEELAELARLKVPLVRVRGRWVELDDRQLKAALRVMERRREGELTAGEVLREVAGGGDEDLPLTQVDADGALGDLLSGEADRRLAPLRTPAAFLGTLRPYQERGLSWLSFLSSLGLGGVLADDMGLGKTAQTLAMLLNERDTPGGAPEPTLLICPMSLVSNWQKEAARFAPSLRVYVHHGGGRRRDDELAAAVGEADLVLTTYGTALRDLAALSAQRWGRVVCDEAQAVKNSAARQAQAVRAIPARTRLALTGTPVENHLAELWSIMEFCNPGLLGPARRFRERYQVPIETIGDEHAAQALKRATGPFILRRLKTDRTIISDLPDKLEMRVWCPLTPEQATLYQAVVEDMMARINDTEGIERRGNVLAAMTRLKQVCNHPAQLLKDGSRLAGRSGKLARLEELAAEVVAEGDKALVFTQYAEFGAILQPYLAAHLDRPVLWLHGGLPKAKRDELVERFQTDAEPMIFLLSLKAAGTGLNLTAANHVIHVDRWWNPAVEDQATDRAFRIGQSRNVQVRKFICAGTLEERIDEMIERKKALAQSVVGTGEGWITDLSTDQLRELFRLDDAAVR